MVTKSGCGKEKNTTVRTHVSKSASVAGWLHDSAFAMAASCAGFFSSQATASVLEHVAQSGTNFATFNSFIIRPRSALLLLSKLKEEAGGQLSGTVRHNRCRKRAMSSASTAAYRLPPSLLRSPKSDLKKCSNNSQIALKALRLMSLSVVRCHCLWGSTARMRAFSTSAAIAGVPLL